MMNLSDLRFTECANFYKLKDGCSLTDTNIHSMMVEVTRGKMRGYLFDKERVDGGNGTRFSLRVFKYKTDRPNFFNHPEPGWDEIRIGFYLFIECDRYVVVLKRYANIPKAINDKLENVDYSTLMALETKPDSVFKKLSMQNLDGSDYAMRNKTYESLDLSSNISTIGVSRYFVRSVKGNNGNDRFSLTLNSSRVNEFKGDLTVRDLCGWVRAKVDEIGALGAMPDTLLSAFAKPEKYSAVYHALQPSSLLVFYGLIVTLKDEQQAQFFHTNSQGQRAQIDNQVLEKYIDSIARAYTSVQIVAKGDGDHYYVGQNNAIEIRKTQAGIRLMNKTWRNIEIEGTQDGEYDGDLQSLINGNHQFNVYFTDKELVYNNRMLFRDARLTASIPQFLKVLKPITALNGTQYEKYNGLSPRGLRAWGPDSVFQVVENTFMPQYTYFICDDYKDEWADHIGIGPDKVSFFVSKHKSSNDSASDFQDVVGQALKDLGNLSPSAGQLNAKAAGWSGLYLTSNMPRFRSHVGTVRDAITLWGNNVMSPNYEREMCLVVDFLSYRTFSQQLTDIANNVPVAHEASLFQRLWILSSFVNGCLECGVKPVIYCKD